MGAAVVWEIPYRIELVGKGVAALMQVGVPQSGGVAGSAGGRAMEAGIPDPYDFVAGFNGDRRGVKNITFRTHVHGEGLGARGMGERKRKRTSEDGEPSG